MNSGIMPNSIRSSLVTLDSSSPRLFSRCFGIAAEADGLAADAASDDVVESDEGAAADEQDVRGIDLDVLLFGVLAAALRRHVADGAFEHLQQRLLHAFAADTSRVMLTFWCVLAILSTSSM